MLAVGQTVLYGANGVCRIEDIIVRQIGRDKIEYYMLKPVMARASTVYVPTHNEELVGRMRRLKTAEEVRQLLDADSEMEWTVSDAERRELFRDIISRGECGELISMTRLIHKKERGLVAAGRHLHLADERQLKESEKMAGEEVATVLGITFPEAVQLILDGIKE